MRASTAKRPSCPPHSPLANSPIQILKEKDPLVRIARLVDIEPDTTNPYSQIDTPKHGDAVAKILDGGATLRERSLFVTVIRRWFKENREVEQTFRAWFEAK